MAKFKVGNVVKLKSGGDRMTVVRVDEWEPTQVHCCWFPLVARLEVPGEREYIYGAELQRQAFEPEMLEKVKKDE